MTFGVGKWTEEFLPLSPLSVALPSLQSRPRLDYGQLWQEPAITGLDWLFTPNPRSEKHLLVALLQASTMCYHRFTLPRNRSTGFGSYPSDLRRFHTSPLVNCGLLISLRLLLFGLVSPLRYTPWHVIQNARCTPLDAHPTITSRFQDF